MQKSRDEREEAAARAAETDDANVHVTGDPGVGGLIADPRDAGEKRAPPGVKGKAPSPDPEPPKAHGDWMPTKTGTGENEGGKKPGG